MFNTKSDNLPLLLKAWKACEEKILLEKTKNTEVISTNKKINIYMVSIFKLILI